MIKTIFTTLLLAFAIYSQAQILDPDYTWIATESRRIKKKGGISPLDGMILKFEKKRVTIGHVFYDSIGYYPLEIKNKKIYFQDTLFGVIKYLTADSLVVDFDKIMRVKFVPLKKGHYTDRELNYWNHTDWTFIYNEYWQDIKLLDSLWGWHPNEKAKICITLFRGEPYRFSNAEKWNIKEINGRNIFTKTTGPSIINEIYDVLDYKNDTIVLEDLKYQDSALILIIKDPAISPGEKEWVMKIIQDRRWYSASLIETANAFDEDSIDNEFTRKGLFLTDSMLFQKKSLLTNQLSFEFLNSNEYKIYESNILRIRGNWKLSETGKQIVLNNGFDPNDYIDLFKVEVDSIVIGKCDLFLIDEKEKDYVDYYYKLVLKK